MTNELLNYFNGDTMAAKVWQDKYAAKGELTPDDMHKRLAKEYARIEANYPLTTGKVSVLSAYGQKRKTLTEEAIYNLFKDFKYIIPAGSVMANLGTDSPTSLSNCFVLGQPKDNIESIFNYARNSAQVFKRRGGAGIDLSLLRPNGAGVKNAANNSSGPVSFMAIYSATTETIGQDGRRAAEMLSIDIRHPDSPEFVKSKSDKTKTTAANISVKIGKDFMEAVANDSDYLLTFPIDFKITSFLDDDLKEFLPVYMDSIPYNKLITYIKVDKSKGYVKKIKARELWNSICRHAHDDAEPGIIFEDNHLEYDPAAVYPDYKPITTNPCGEIFMGKNDSCRLSALNLYSFVDQPFTNSASINFEKLYAYSYEQLVLSDDLVDLEIEAIDRILAKIQPTYLTKFPRLTQYYRDFFINDQTEEFQLWWSIRETGRKGRRVGNGFTALADMVAAMNLSYGSNESLELIQSVLHTKMQAELDASIDLSILRGSFDGWSNDLEYKPTQKMSGISISGTNQFYDFIYQNFTEQYNRMYQHGRRNISISTVAPTGTTSLMTQTTSGIEPLFQAVHKRRVKTEGEEFDFKSEDGQKFKEYIVIHPKLQDYVESRRLVTGSIVGEEMWQEIYKMSPYYKSCANDISWKQRIDLQALVQQYTTHSINKLVPYYSNMVSKLDELLES